MENLFTDIETKEEQKPVTVLGKTFSSDEERREYFRNELRNKLPELKEIEGFPIGEDEDIINLSDPPYYTACPNPWLNDFIAEWEEEKKELEKQGKRKADFEVTEPYASDVSEGKNNPFYRAHSYHTKVPHPAIMKYISHYAQPGDIVFDGFAGTGMTGVACKAMNRKNENPVKLPFIGIDLSSIASFIAYNFNNDWNINSITKEFLDVLNRVDKELSWIYETNVKNEKYRINYIIWSNVYFCPHCNHENSYWNLAFDKKTEKVKSNFNCDDCNSLLTKRDLLPQFETFFDPFLNKSVKQIKRIPVILDCTKGKSRIKKKPDEIDLENYEKILKIYNKIELNSNLIVDGDETKRNSKIGITHLHHYYEKRSMLSLLHIFREFKRSNNFNKLLFIFTSIISMRCTKRMPYRAGGKSAGSVNNMSIPSISQEYNVIDTIKRKFKDIIKAKSIFEENSSDFLISNQSSTNIKNIKNNSIDYIFLDPPFGSNIMYSELSSLSESWLKILTNIEKEAIENRTQNKNIITYQDIITASLKEFNRILKPGKWMTVEFSNTSSSIWNVIQNSIQNAGFIISNVTGIDKKQGSFNAVTTKTAVKQDLVISCYKPSSEFDKKFKQHQTTDVAIWDFIEEHLNHLPIHIIKENSTTAIIERSPKILFDRLVSFYVTHSLPVPLDASKFQQGLRERFIERDGMFFTQEQVLTYDKKKAEAPDFIQPSLFIASEQDGIMWLKNMLSETQATYQEIQPKWMQALAGLRKGDLLPELKDILEENFLKDEKGKWYLPDPENEADLEKIRIKRLLKEFDTYKEIAQKPKGKVKTARVEALRAGFMHCYQEKDFQTLVLIADKIPKNLLMEDEVLLQYYDIAITRV